MCNTVRAEYLAAGFVDPTADKCAHTPGPWEVGESRESESEPRHIQIRAYYPGDGIPLKKIAVCYFGQTDAERVANADLIASAPALLAEVATLKAELFETKSQFAVECIAHEKAKAENDRLREHLTLMLGHLAFVDQHGAHIGQVAHFPGYIDARTVLATGDAK